MHYNNHFVDGLDLRTSITATFTTCFCHHYSNDELLE